MLLLELYVALSCGEIALSRFVVKALELTSETQTAVVGIRDVH